MKENSRSFFPAIIIKIFLVTFIGAFSFRSHAIINATGDLTCAHNEEVLNGACVLRCVSPQVRVSGVCTAPAVTPPSCTAEQELVAGACVARCTPPQARVEGICTTPTATPPTCTATQTLVDGACVDCASPRTVQAGQCLCSEANQIFSSGTCSACPNGATRDSAHPEQCKCTDSGNQLVNGICRPDWPITNYRWSGGPTILKTSQFRDSSIAGGGATCGTNYELCIGPATATQGERTVVRMVKCFMPRNSPNCPEEFSAENNCVFLGDAGEGVGTMRSSVAAADPLIDPSASIPPIACTATTPACRGGSLDVWDVGCKCQGASYTFTNAATTCVRSKAECDSRQARAGSGHSSVPATASAITCVNGEMFTTGHTCTCNGSALTTGVCVTPATPGAASWECPTGTALAEVSFDGGRRKKTCRCDLDITIEVPVNTRNAGVCPTPAAGTSCDHGEYDAARTGPNKCLCPGPGHLYVGPHDSCPSAPLLPGQDIAV